MANKDRVADVYFRRHDVAETQDACRERIHWLCAQARGGRVVDIGCSQGIASVILAREGHEVVGLDIEEESLKAARDLLAQEPPHVQERVRFIVADAFTAEFPPGSFDTALLGEVLEHLAQPERLLARVSEWLAEGGQVVVTVPHGYHPYHDHKRSFYLGTLVALLTQRFTIALIEPIADRFLGAVVAKPPAGQRAPAPSIEQLLAWSRLEETLLERRERDAYAARLAGQASQEKLRQQVTELRASVGELTKTAKEADAVRAQMRQQMQELTQRERAALERVARLEQASQAARAETERVKIALEQTGQAARAEVSRLKAEASRLKAAAESEMTRRRQAEARATALQGQVRTLNARLALKLEEVRYRLGDAFVRAARPSVDTLKLPFRMLALLRDGLRRRRARAAGEVAAARESAAEPPSRVAGTPEMQASNGAARTPAAASAPSLPGGLDGIPTLSEAFASAPPELRRRPDLKLAAVTDEFSWRAWQYEADVYTFTPQSWQAALEERPPDLLLVESAWSGLNDSWYFQVRDLGKRGDAIKHYAIPDMVAWCRQRGIPTVFYNKEDPPNFDVFVDAAGQFDHVFTSDANCIPAYRKHVGHERVYALPFAAQPRIHNPVMTGTRTGSVCFAGTWYAHRHFDRQNHAELILRPALDYDLHIFDRMARSDNPNYRWPDAFLPAIRGALPYAQMLAAYKRYKVFMNINSVTDSPTMFSRRVFELLACGTPVISAYSIGIEQLLGADVVLMSDGEAQTRAHLERVLSDDAYRERLALLGQRRVFAEHTYANRLQTILDTVGLARKQVPAGAIRWVAAITHPAQVEAAWETFRRQEGAAKHLVLCALDPAAVAAAGRITGSDPAVRVVADAEARTWGRLLARAIAGCGGDTVAALNPEDVYGPHYLMDYRHVWLYCSEAAVGKAAYYQRDGAAAPRAVQRGKDYRVVSEVWPWTLCLRAPTAAAAGAKLAGAQSAWEFWNRMMRGLGRVYSSDPFNYVRCGDGTGPTADAAAPARRPEALAEVQVATV